MSQFTDRLLVATIILLSLYDIAVVATSGSEATISRRALYWSQQYPLISLAAGVLIGHLFCPQTIRVAH